MPDPSWQARQQAQRAQQIHQNHVRHHRDLHHMAHARHTGAPHPYRAVSRGPVRGGGLGGFLLLLVVVAGVVYVAHDPELRATVETFARDLLSKVQSG
ncbi:MULTISPECIES: hypothetical protein [unclassified Streptomyces]|uniref:hypothetical protein n=1 Tax=unclassified Streptomyces TaxID=2593676 RepID=UPI0033A004B8|nr:hypothetical protein OG199_11615 [Streptomyces sp. NBC_01176]